MFHTSLQIERDLGLNHWERDCPTVDGISPGRPASRAEGCQGDRLGRAAALLCAVRGPAREDPGLDGGVRESRGRADHQGRGRRGSRGLYAEPRPRHRLQRQGRHLQAVRARREQVAIRQAAARARAHLREEHAAARTLFRRVLQSDPDGGRVLRLPGADHDGSVRDHGVRRHSRRPDGLLGGRENARATSGQEQVDPRHLPAVGSGALQGHRADRRQRHPRRALRANGAQAGGNASLAAARCWAWPTWWC